LEIQYVIIKNMGRTKTIKTPEDLYSLFEEYKQWRDENPIKKNDFRGKDAYEVILKLERPLSMVGFSNFVYSRIGMSWGIKHYIQNTDDKYKDFLPIASRIKDEIREDQVSGGMAGIYNASITARLNNLSENVKTEVAGNIVHLDLGHGIKPD